MDRVGTDRPDGATAWRILCVAALLAAAVLTIDQLRRLPDPAVGVAAATLLSWVAGFAAQGAGSLARAAAHGGDLSPRRGPTAT